MTTEIIIRRRMNVCLALPFLLSRFPGLFLRKLPLMDSVLAWFHSFFCWCILNSMPNSIHML